MERGSSKAGRNSSGGGQPAVGSLLNANQIKNLPVGSQIEVQRTLFGSPKEGAGDVFTLHNWSYSGEDANSRQVWHGPSGMEFENTLSEIAKRKVSEDGVPLKVKRVK